MEGERNLKNTLKSESGIFSDVIIYISWIPRTQTNDDQNSVRDKQTIPSPFIELTN